MNVNFGLEELIQMVDWHIQLRPAMTAQDVYKLLLQGIRGAEHIMPSPEIFTIQLREELATLKSELNEPLCELIRPDHELSRINLRAYIAKSQDICWLVDVCLRTGKRKWGTRQDLIEAWQTFLYAVHSGSFPTIAEDEASTFNEWVEKHRYPAAHHSDIYKKIYTPAYRLVANEYLGG
jgi:hypothetical protein